MNNPILVTNALPYANGPLHLGHLVGYVQGDIWVRAQRQSSKNVHFICADDTHGTPIMLAAEKADLSPEQFVALIQQGHEQDFADFGVAFDHYGSTNTASNQALTTAIYKRLHKGGHIVRKEVQQLYDPQAHVFLSDRYVKGGCPKCASPDQYGDNCEVCGATYDATDLTNPYSTLTGATPELGLTDHFFFKVSNFEPVLRQWLDGNVVLPATKNKLAEWLDGESGLRDWCISRDGPYFGFEIPNEPNKFFYVWLDAPIGYLSSFQDHVGGDVFEQLASPSAPQIHHFIGKDIVNFHGLFWPSVLSGANLPLPTKLHVNGYLTVNGQKMSKSRGTFIQARTYLDVGLDPEALRYYLAAKSLGDVSDVDLNLADFVTRVNSDVVGKFVNLASRSAGFINKYFDGQLAFMVPDPSLCDKFVSTVPKIIELYENNAPGHAIRLIMELADEANKYVDLRKPWELAKHNPSNPEIQLICTQALNLFRILNVALKPILPRTTQQAEEFLNAPTSSWDEVSVPLLDHRINAFTPLFSRIDPKVIEELVERSKDTLAKKASP